MIHPPSASDTKTRILDAAERLFAQEGFAATSHRHITRAAGVNLAAVNYHFGSKDELLKAVFARRLEPINRGRLERLRAHLEETAPEPPRVEAVVRALVEPAFAALQSAGEGGERFMQLVGRTHSDSSPQIRVCFLGQFEEVHRAFLGALARALPWLEESELMLRYHFAVGSMAHTLAWLSKLRGPDVPPILEDPKALRDSLVRFAAAGLSVPLGKP
jgi:AcrR family transcriptional regulator